MAVIDLTYNHNILALEICWLARLRRRVFLQEMEGARRQGRDRCSTNEAEKSRERVSEILHNRNLHTSVWSRRFGDRVEGGLFGSA